MSWSEKPRDQNQPCLAAVIIVLGMAVIIVGFGFCKPRESKPPVHIEPPPAEKVGEATGKTVGKFTRGHAGSW